MEQAGAEQMAKINLERRAEIAREKRARTKSQLVDAAEALFSKRPWESVTVDEVVNEAGVAKGTFYTHFNDLNELAAAVADELIRSLDELIQPQRRSISDPLLRVAFGCSAFMEKALEDRPWGSLAARMARSYKAVGQVARSRLSEDLRQALRHAPQPGLTLDLALEVTLGILLQIVAAIGEGRLERRDVPEAVRAILAAIGVGKRDAASIITQLADMRNTMRQHASADVEAAGAAATRKPAAPLKRAKATRGV
jgi:AcrR family transcriptional regulator